MLFLLNLVLGILHIATFEKLSFIGRLISAIKRKRTKDLKWYADNCYIPMSEFEGSRAEYWRAVSIHQLITNSLVICLIVGMYVGIRIFETIL